MKFSLAATKVFFAFNKFVMHTKCFQSFHLFQTCLHFLVLGYKRTCTFNHDEKRFESNIYHKVCSGNQDGGVECSLCYFHCPMCCVHTPSGNVYTLIVKLVPLKLVLRVSVCVCVCLCVSMCVCVFLCVSVCVFGNIFSFFLYQSSALFIRNDSCHLLSKVLFLKCLSSRAKFGKYINEGFEIW